MPKAFTTWTVLPHGPIEKHADNLWSVEGTMADGRTKRLMTLVRLRDGRLLIHNGIALREPEMKELEAFGAPSAILVPNGYHRMDARIYKDRYPQARVYCPKGSTGRVRDVVFVDGDYDAVPQDDTVRVYHLDGMPAEGVVEIHSADGTTLVLNDALMNIKKLGGVMGFFLGPTGQPAIPRAVRWFLVKDKRALRAHFERMAGIADLRRVLVSHGKALTDRPAEALRQAAALLG